jgi:hypothetical protein
MSRLRRIDGAGGGNRTPTGKSPTDFKSVASTDSATPTMLKPRLAARCAYAKRRETLTSAVDAIPHILAGPEMGHFLGTYRYS